MCNSCRSIAIMHCLIKYIISISRAHLFENLLCRQNTLQAAALLSRLVSLIQLFSKLSENPQRELWALRGPGKIAPQAVLSGGAAGPRQCSTYVWWQTRGFVSRPFLQTSQNPHSRKTNISGISSWSCRHRAKRQHYKFRLSANLKTGGRCYF